MLRYLAIGSLTLAMLIVVPFLNTLLPSHKAARQFVVDSEKVARTVGRVTTVIPRSRPWRFFEAIDDCATFNLYVIGTKGSERVTIRIHQLQAKGQWTLVELVEGSSHIYTGCPGYLGKGSAPAT